MRVPQDQGLFLTIFVACCLAATVVMWVFLPVHHVVENDEGGGEQPELFTLAPAVTPEGRVIRMEKALAMASAVIAKSEGAEKEKGKTPETHPGTAPQKTREKAQGKEKGTP